MSKESTDAQLVKRVQKGDKGAFDLLVVNLYPFEATVAGGADYGTCVENIDIGGPAMIRAAAKNHAHVAVVVDPEDYETVLEEIRQGGTTLATRKRLAAAAYARTAAYDAAVSSWMAGAVQRGGRDGVGPRPFRP